MTRLTAQVKEITQDHFKWIDMMKPTSRELNLLLDEFDFPRMVLEDCLSEHQRCKVDINRDFIFVTLLFPCYNKDLMRVEAEEVDFFLSKDYLITLHEGNLSPLVSLASLCQDKSDVREKYMSNGPAMLMYQIINLLLECCYPLLERIGETLNDINKCLFINRSNQLLVEISQSKTQIMNYRRVIHPLGNAILSLQEATSSILTPEFDFFMKDIKHNIENLWAMLENYKEVIETLDSTYASLTNQRINKLMRTFTVLQLLITPVIIVNMLFSINVQGIPMATSPHAFWILLAAITTVISLIASVLFIKRNTWF